MDQKQYTRKAIKQKMYKTDLFPLIEKENLTDTINLSGPPVVDSKYTLNIAFNVVDPLDSIPPPKTENENIFQPTTEKMALDLLQKHENQDKFIIQLEIKSWHNYKIKLFLDTSEYSIKQP